ncbi:chromosome-associated kinesin KIF4-like, partial [Teleopsis dalmanni]|uniref:chromosome-associated kinesin KIF4-like n=1 Tax=Teleopsis dalmanni TaxID=139649 RepID=UPI0018CDE44D
MSEIDSVRVALRVRPLVHTEIERGCQVAVKRTAPGEQQVAVNKNDLFTFNYVFDQDSTQEEVYSASVCEMLDKLFSGFNATILAYGQTGSGKTHTMGTTYDGAFNEHIGVIPRAMHDIFKRIEELGESHQFVVKCSFVELYQEQLFDLLSSKPREQSTVELREDRTGIIMQDLTDVVVRTATETTACLMRGSIGRAVASTAMNSQSSRSHAIFTVTIQATKKDTLTSMTTSKFHLVDLAGSERSKKTKTTGDRFKEGVKINQGLLALGNVISALGSGQGAGHVRYRDSKLTRLLQDSLGGNSVTLMIACVSPADYNVAETLSTLRYADRARQIKNKPIINQDPHAMEVSILKGIIQKLRMELLAVGGNMSASLKVDVQGAVPVIDSNPADYNNFHEIHSKKYLELQEKNRYLQQKLQATLHDVADNEMRAHIAEVAHEKLKDTTVQLRKIIMNLEEEFKIDSSPEKIPTL